MQYLKISNAQSPGYYWRRIFYSFASEWEMQGQGLKHSKMIIRSDLVKIMIFLLYNLMTFFGQIPSLKI